VVLHEVLGLLRIETLQMLLLISKNVLRVSGARTSHLKVAGHVVVGEHVGLREMVNAGLPVSRVIVCSLLQASKRLRLHHTLRRDPSTQILTDLAPHHKPVAVAALNVREFTWHLV